MKKEVFPQTGEMVSNYNRECRKGAKVEPIPQNVLTEVCHKGEEGACAKLAYNHSEYCFVCNKKGVLPNTESVTAKGTQFEDCVGYPGVQLTKRSTPGHLILVE